MSDFRVAEPGRRLSAAALSGGSIVAAIGAASTAWQLARLVPWAVEGRVRGPAGPLLAAACILAVVVLGRLCLAALATAACGAAAGLAPRRPLSGRVRELCAWLAVSVSPRLLRPVLASVIAGTVALAGAASASAAPSTGAVRTPASASGLPIDSATGSTSTDVHDLRLLPDPGWSPGFAAGSRSAVLPTPTWTPQRPAAPRRDHVDVRLVVAAPSRAREVAPVVVRRGDTLWAIAARHLGPAATDADVAREWPRWWQANRGVIGGDPDVLLPGQVLVEPTLGGAR